MGQKKRKLELRLKAKSNPKPAPDSTSLYLSAKNNSILYDPSRIFIPPNVPTEPASLAANAHGNQLAKIPLTDVKLPKPVLDKISGNPVDWPEWSGWFSLTVDDAALDDSVRMKYLKILVNEKAKAPIEGIRYNAAKYRVDWQTPARDFAKLYLVVKSQLNNFTPIPSSSLTIHRKHSSSRTLFLDVLMSRFSFDTKVT